jgi:hypothetical protein
MLTIKNIQHWTERYIQCYYSVFVTLDPKLVRIVFYSILFEWMLGLVDGRIEGWGGQGGGLANGKGTGNRILHVIPLVIDNFSLPWYLLMKFCRVVQKCITWIRKYQTLRNIMFLMKLITAKLGKKLVPEIGTSSIVWAQWSRFYLKIETESSLRNVVS